MNIYYLLHDKSVNIDDNYQYDKFIFLIKNKNNKSPLSGVTFDDGSSYVNMCVHYVYPNNICDSCDTITASEKTFDNYMYPVCEFKKVIEDDNNIIWIIKSEYLKNSRNRKISKILN